MANLEDEKMNPAQVLIGLVAVLIFVVIFCIVVWKVTHANHTSVVINQNVESSQDEVSGIPDSDEDKWVSSEEESSEQSSEDAGSDDVANMTFTTVNEVVTAKDVTNLRSEPSTSQGKATVVSQLKNGTYAQRIGINDATGWSKLEVNGQIVYAVSQYLILQEDENQATEE